jgi:phosphoglycolate phosphatase/pyrophosphatase PpaX
LRPFPESIKGIIFDLDGTIVDRDRLVVHCTRELAKRLLGRAPNQNQIPWGLHETDTIRKLALQTSGDHFERALDIYKRCLHANLKMVGVFPGMRDLLDRLRKADRPIALVTSIPDRSLVDAVLERVQVKHWFKTVVTGEDVERPKPDPEGVLLALQGLSLSQSQVIMVGDSAADIQAGRKAGMVTGAALWGLKDLRDLWGPLASRARPDFEFQTVAELDRFLFRGLVR